MSDSSKRLSREEYVEAILLFLFHSDRPSHNLKEIAEAVGVSQSTIKGYVLFALAREYVEEQLLGTSKVYYLTEEGRKRASESHAKQGNSSE